MNITLEGEVASRQPDSIPKRETRNEKRLRNAAIAFSYRHYVAAYLASRVHRAVPSNQNRHTALRQAQRILHRRTLVSMKCYFRNTRLQFVKLGTVVIIM